MYSNADSKLAVKVDRLYKSFGNLKVLREITTEIHKGEVIAIIGPSGCGKSTFLRCLNLLEIPTSGKIYIDGVDITLPKADIMKIRQKVGMVFQHFHLFPHMTVLQNVIYAPVKVKQVAKDEARLKGLELPEKVGLSDKAEVYPSKLSGGTKTAGGDRPLFGYGTGYFVDGRTDFCTRSRNGQRSVRCDESFDENRNYNGNCHSRNGFCAGSRPPDIVSRWRKGGGRCAAAGVF
jgi:hypothetical protein